MKSLNKPTLQLHVSLERRFSQFCSLDLPLQTLSKRSYVLRLIAI